MSDITSLTIRRLCQRSQQAAANGDLNEALRLGDEAMAAYRASEFWKPDGEFRRDTLRGEEGST